MHQSRSFLCLFIYFLTEHVWDTKPYAMLRLGTPSLLLSPCSRSLSHFQPQWGCIKGPGFSTQPAARPFMQNFLLPHSAGGLFARRSSRELKARLRFASLSLVRCENRPFPGFWSWETTAGCWQNCHTLSGIWHCIALYAEGSPKLKERKTKLLTYLETQKLQYQWYNSLHIKTCSLPLFCFGWFYLLLEKKVETATDFL